MKTTIRTFEDQIADLQKHFGTKYTQKRNITDEWIRNLPSDTTSLEGLMSSLCIKIERNLSMTVDPHNENHHHYLMAAINQHYLLKYIHTKYFNK